MVIILAYNQKINYNVRIIIKNRTNIYAHNLGGTMILKRKIYKKLLEWKNECQGKKALLIEGARRIGKSTICEEFGKNEYERLSSDRLC